MSTTTSGNLGLTKLQLSDAPPDITRLNTNWDALDSHVTSLEAKTSTHDSDISTLQNVNNTQNNRLSTLENKPLQVVIGTYEGNGNASRQISLGFAPSAVMLIGHMPEYGGYTWQEHRPVFFGINRRGYYWDGHTPDEAIDGEDQEAQLQGDFETNDTGFVVRYDLDKPYVANTLRHKYTYIAFR